VTLRLDHLVFPVTDAAASVHFYRDVLGLPALQAIAGDDWDGFPWLMVLFGIPDGRQLVIVGLRGAPRPAADPRPKDTRHVAFAVESAAEQEGWQRRLDAHGIAWRAEDHGTQQSIYFEDPDGLVLEITTPPSDRIGGESGDAASVIERWLAS
jgi:catechol 2,3-dioxygenase-like lactoylglutathione lyase family enzyme